MACEGSRARHTHNAAGRAAQNRVLALERVSIGEPARGLHEKQPYTRHVGRHLFHVAAQNRRQVGVHHRGVAAADEFHHRAGFMRAADLRESELGRDTCGRALVRRVAVTMHENDGDATQTSGIVRQHLFPQQCLIQRLQQLAPRTDPLVCFHHRAVQQLGQHDVAVEQARSVLVRNPQRVTKATRGHQQRGLPLALQQSVGGHRGAHLHTRHLRGRDRLARQQAQQMPYARHRGIAVLLRVVAEQLVRYQCAVRPLADHVGKGTATVDPELPAGVYGSGSLVLHGLVGSTEAGCPWSVPHIIQKCPPAT